MSDRQKELGSAFAAAAEADGIVAARYGVLEAATTCLCHIADHLQAAGWISRSDRLLACALLSRLASELTGGMVLLLRGTREYAAGTLLRQLIEVEYLMFRAYGDPSQLERWYTADARALRDEFKPQAMRKASGGLFRDEEYWLHCEVGGHPHPRARMLLRGYPTPLQPAAFLLPDSIHHLRRLWTSLRLLLPKLDGGQSILDEHAAPLQAAVGLWERSEHPTVLAFDGIVSSEAAG